MDFDDVSATYWGGDAIDFVSARGVMTGDGTGNFNPNDLMNRASMAVLLHNLENNPDGFSAESFDDVGSTWFTEAVEWVSGMGIMDGYGNGLFGAKDNITREQFAAILYRYAGSPKSSGSPVGFADSDEVSSWAADAMSWAIENGIISGEGNNLNPKGYATRAQVATMLMRFMNIG